MKRPDVTIFADASLCLQSGASGWGAWVVSSAMGSTTFGGAFKRTVRKSHEAELFGIANALVGAGIRGYYSQNCAVMVQCDNIEALGILMKEFSAQDRPAPGGLPCLRRRKALWDSHREAIKAIRPIVCQFGLALIVRHVKGHQDGAGRQWVNRTVDEIAKAGMHNARNQIKQVVNV